MSVLANKSYLRRVVEEAALKLVREKGAVLEEELVRLGMSRFVIPYFRRKHNLRRARWGKKVIIYVDPREAAKLVIKMGYRPQKAKHYLPFDVRTALKEMKSSPLHTSTSS